MIDLIKTGEIIKLRIKELNFTQTEFAEKAGIGVSTLKKYISGQLPYSIELLDKFSELLNCSYEYLLGKSPKPHGSYKEVQYLTGLSDMAIAELSEIAAEKDINNSARYLAMEKALENRELLCTIGNYLSFSHYSGVQGEFIGIPLSDKDIPDLLLFRVGRILEELRSEIKNTNKENTPVVLSKNEIDQILKEKNIEWNNEYGKYIYKET